MNPFRPIARTSRTARLPALRSTTRGFSPEPVSDRGDVRRATFWIAACVALGVAFNAFAVGRVLLADAF